MQPSKLGLAILFVVLGVSIFSFFYGKAGFTGFLASGEKIELPALYLIIPVALVDSINPCAIGVLIFLIATLLAISKHDLRKMFVVGTIYITAVYITYLLAGLVLFQIIAHLQALGVAQIINVAVSILVIILGLLEIKDFLWYGQGITLAIPPKYAGKIKEMAKKISIPGAIILGVFASSVELPCTGGPYLAITTILSKNPFNFTVFLYYLIYNFFFVLPLIVILLTVYFGMDISKVQQWKDRQKRFMRLWIGLILVSLGVLLLLYSLNIITLRISLG
jgi:cytochrome c biogenesis protein CcdA